MGESQDTIITNSCRYEVVLCTQRASDNQKFISPTFKHRSYRSLIFPGSAHHGRMKKVTILVIDEVSLPLGCKFILIMNLIHPISLLRPCTPPFVISTAPAPLLACNDIVLTLPLSSPQLPARTEIRLFQFSPL